MPSQDTHATPTRRRYSAEFKRELVERCLQPGASVSAIALENGVNANVVFRWRRQHRRGIVRAQEHDSGVGQAVLLPVELAAANAMAAKQDARSSRPPVPTGVIEIEIGAARVRLRGAVDDANVRCVLHTLRALA